MYYLDDGLLIHDQGGAWAWFRLSTRRHELLSYDQMAAEVEKEAHRQVLAGYLQARPATSAELRWLLIRSLWRGLADLPEPERRETWGGEARALFEGAVIHNEHRWLRIEQPGHGDFFMASVGIHHFPDELRMPGGERLNPYQELPLAA